MAGSRGASSKNMAPSKKEHSTTGSAKGSQKRKRNLENSSADTSKSAPVKKPKRAKTSPAASTVVEQPSQRSQKPVEAGLQSPSESGDGKAIPPSVNGTIDERKPKDGKPRSSGKINGAAVAPDNTDLTESALGRPNSEKSRKRSKTTSQSHQEKGESSPKNGKHSGILSKFERTAKMKETAKAKGGDTGDVQGKKTEVETAEPVVAHGLEPLPQPQPAPEQIEKPTYSSLPEWLANPLRASADGKSKFSDLGIDRDILRLLEANGFHDAFAVQSTVLPLLLQGPKHHPGDLCISAATGSGKTLSYVLPLVKTLQQLPAPRLRGLVVVPTRELVKQARETCELFAAGSGLRIGSAIGNVAIKEEQQSLMRVDPYFSPGIFDRQQRGELEGEHWTDFNLQQYIFENEHHSASLQDYVEKRDPNVDILICTPGRLVDHIRHTKGFTLGHLQWLVIDEADRLLSESFQEWVDVVMNSLDARTSPEALGFTGKFLSDMGLPMQTPEPKKVILSATMTRDISKLNTLRLANPKMVIVGSEDNTQDGGMASDERFTLPPTLKEHSISVGDGVEKPLYLLRLLLSHIKVAVQESTKAASDQASESDDSSSVDSSEASASEDSDESSGDDSSESESTSSDESSSEDEDSEEDTPTPNVEHNTVLIFTKSSEAASRLSRLLSILHPALGSRVDTIIKSNKSSASRRTLTAYRRGKISIIVATDRASRGLDLRSLKHVVNYDVPSSVTSYVHRVGRTARAGEKGSAWTLVAHREGRWFANEIAKDMDGKITRSAKLEKVNMKLDGMDEAKSRYGSALETLEQEVKTDGKAKE